ncbi:MAG: hypothetical protein WC959_05670 [Kiritimatiellales bacterium]
MNAIKQNEIPATGAIMPVSSHDRKILKTLAFQKAEIAALPIHQEKKILWQKLNDKQSVRPMVWINEVCWHEMNINDELTLQCEGAWARNQELILRKELYQWKHFPCDMIIDPWIYCQKIICSTEFGITEQAVILKTDDQNSIVSHHYETQIESFADLEKIKIPEIRYDGTATELHYEMMSELFSEILPVKKEGQKHIWFTPWDFLIRVIGAETAMLMMYENPELVHAMVDRVVDAWMNKLDQLVEQNLLSLDCNNTRIGSGGYGYVSDLPGNDYHPDKILPHNMWGCSNAQIFSEISPEFHWEFAVAHDLRWMERWGLNYYGCCEQLDNKAGVLAKIPNLRKVSVSPWCNTERAIENLGEKYVLSRKPNPAILAEGMWHPERARKDIRTFLNAAERRCHIELIMKDISTVRYHPQRLWEWAQIAMEEVSG